MTTTRIIPQLVGFCFGAIAVYALIGTLARHGVRVETQQENFSMSGSMPEVEQGKREDIVATAAEVKESQ